MNSQDRTAHHTPVILITGAARRIGAAIAGHLHAAGARVVIHYRSSEQEAQALRTHLETVRPDSAALISGDLTDTDALASRAIAAFGRLDGLVNNASGFYPTPMGRVDEAQWNDLMGSNLKAPFFLSQALAPELARNRGTIVNLVDIHGHKPLKDHPVYSMAKAGLIMMTRSLAKELGPDVRVNAVAPGAILWPETGMEHSVKQTILDRTALKRPGAPEDIADAVAFLMLKALYVTGQILAVDGGRSLNL